jgi:hypothetical protein
MEGTGMQIKYQIGINYTTYVNNRIKKTFANALERAGD